MIWVLPIELGGSSIYIQTKHKVSCTKFKLRNILRVYMFITQ